MSLCLATAALAVGLAVDSFTLAWTHSVERTEWRETWRVEGAELVLSQAQVRGSGAGMEPPEGADLRNGWWVYTQDLRVPALLLANSGVTVSDWRFCTALRCDDLQTWLSTGASRADLFSLRAGSACRPLGTASP